MSKKQTGDESIDVKDRPVSDEEKETKTDKRGNKKLEKELNELKETVAQLEEERDTLKEAFQRKTADFDNYRKRIQREMVEQEVMANKELILRILPIIDNFERGMKAAEDTNNFEALLEGIKMSHRHFHDLFEEFHVKPIEAVGKEFDHNLHEALMMEEQEGVEFDNTVTEEFEKGYMMGDRVIRHSKVKVAKKSEKK